MQTLKRSRAHLIPTGRAWTAPSGRLHLLLPLAACGLISLNACEITTAGAVYSMVEGSSLNQTGKTASDHLISSITGQDCNLLRYQQTGRYCLSSAQLAEMAAAEKRYNPGYCYRHLAQVVCYTEPDPTQSDETRVFWDQNFHPKPASAMSGTVPQGADVPLVQ